MARANLTVDAELIAAWRARNINGAALRWIQADVDAPSARIVLRGVRAWGAPDGGVHVPLSDSFALIRADVKSAPGARLYLICLDDNPAASAATNTDRWVVMSIVLEGTPPKARMLVAAARDDVKRTLSSAAGGAFAPDYHVTELEEIDAATYASHADRSDPTASMTRLEKDVADIARLSAAEALAAGPRSLGMATVPFALSKEASDALSHLLNSGPGVVQLSVAAAVARGSGAAAPVVGAASNVIALANTVTLHADDGLRASVTREVLRLQAETGAQPRFYAVHTHSNADAASPGMNVLLYVCPGAAPPKSRMAYATAKAALVAEAFRICALRFDRVVEAGGDPEDVVSALDDLWAVAPVTNAALSPASSATEVGGASDAARVTHHRGVALPGMIRK